MKILVGVTGSIAAYKSADLVRLLQKNGHTVKVMMTESATKFISPLTFQALTGAAVNVSLWDEGKENGGMTHIELGDWADLIVVAPASADTISKIKYGFADSALLATILASKAKLMICPAMNVNMYTNSVTQDNLVELNKRGIEIVEPDEGDLACGWIGRGRLKEIKEIVVKIENLNLKKGSTQDLLGKKFLVTAGGTKEYIDPVRYLTNGSSGKMGISICEEIIARGGEVTLIHASISVPVPKNIKRVIKVSTALEMHREVFTVLKAESSKINYVIMCAAISDFRVKNYSKEKLKKDEKKVELNLQLVKNPDILKEISEWRRKSKNKKVKIIGFALETVKDEKQFCSIVRKKLENKGADVIFGNRVEIALEGDQNQVWGFSKSDKKVEKFKLATKKEVAHELVNYIVKDK